MANLGMENTCQARMDEPGRQAGFLPDWVSSANYTVKSSARDAKGAAIGMYPPEGRFDLFTGYCHLSIIRLLLG